MRLMRMGITNTNKYLGVLEGADIMQKEKVKQVYLRRVHRNW